MPTNELFRISVYYTDNAQRDWIINALQAIDPQQVQVFKGRIDGVANAVTIAALRDFGAPMLVKAPDGEKFVTQARRTSSSAQTSQAAEPPTSSAEEMAKRQANREALRGHPSADAANRIQSLRVHTEQYRRRRNSTASPDLGDGLLAAGGPTASSTPQTGSGEEVFNVLVKIPVRSSYRRELREIGNVCAYEPPNLFRMFLSPAGEQRVKQVGFVVDVARYGIEQTVTSSLIDMVSEPDTTVTEPPLATTTATGTDAGGDATLLAAPLPTADVKPAATTFDLLVHRAPDTGRVAAAIIDAGGKIVEQAADTIRFDLPSADMGIIGTLADLPEVRKITPYQPPSLRADRARFLTGIDTINTGADGKLVDTYTGNGEVVAVFDSGIDKTHPDFNGRIKEAVSYQGCPADDEYGHGTHVCGILAGTGTASGGAIRGTAPGSQLVVFGILGADHRLKTPPDVGDLLKLAITAERGAKIINLSWGQKFASEYEFGSLHLDRFIYEHEDVLVVVAAGNSGAVQHDRYVFKSVGTPATAKNAISCGASGSDRQKIDLKWCDLPWQVPPPTGSFKMCSPEIVGVLSSRGPTDFDSVKPDVCACGIWVLAPRAAKGMQALFDPWKPPDTAPPVPNQYVYLGGTSMATPVVSGAAAVLREYLRVAADKSDPTAALLKAILIASARRLKPFTKDLGDPFVDLVGYPDFHQGFGRIDLSTVLPHPGAPKQRKLLFADVRNGSAQALAAKSDVNSSFAAIHRYAINVSSNAQDPLRVVLAWTDIPGKFLHNNLQLYVEGPASLAAIGNAELTYHRDPFSADSLARAGAPAGVQFEGIDFDKYNNAEQIIVNAPVNGDYRISVIAQYTDPEEKPQGYALCVSGEMNSQSLQPV